MRWMMASRRLRHDSSPQSQSPPSSPKLALRRAPLRGVGASGRVASALFCRGDGDDQNKMLIFCVLLVYFTKVRLGMARRFDSGGEGAGGRRRKEEAVGGPKEG